jgi:hypothetical protein
MGSKNLPENKKSGMFLDRIIKIFRNWEVPVRLERAATCVPENNYTIVAQEIHALRYEMAKEVFLKYIGTAPYCENTVTNEYYLNYLSHKEKNNG